LKGRAAPKARPLPQRVRRGDRVAVIGVVLRVEAERAKVMLPAPEWRLSSMGAIGAVDPWLPIDGLGRLHRNAEDTMTKAPGPWRIEYFTRDDAESERAALDRLAARDRAESPALDDVDPVLDEGAESGPAKQLRDNGEGPV
jgi:hypothetical protein